MTKVLEIQTVTWKTYRIARLEILVDEIENVAKKETFPFWNDSDRLQYITELIKEHKKDEESI